MNTTRKFGGGRKPTGTPSLAWSCAVVIVSLLAGASIVHNIYKPNLTLPPVEIPGKEEGNQGGGSDHSSVSVAALLKRRRMGLRLICDLVIIVLQGMRLRAWLLTLFLVLISSSSCVHDFNVLILYLRILQS